MNENTYDQMSLLEKYFKVESLLRRYRHFGRKDRERGRMGADPHRGQGRVLSLLKLQPEISQKDLGYLLDMRNQSLGELLSKLERNGYITREPSEQDRRVMVVRLTDEGRAAAEKMEEEQQDFENPFACLSEEECGKLSEILDKVITAMEDRMGEVEDERYCGPFGGFDPRDPRMEQWAGHLRRAGFGGRGPKFQGSYAFGMDDRGMPHFSWDHNRKEDEDDE